MKSSAQILISPSSDDRLWSKLHDRVDSILEQRKPKQCSSSSNYLNCVESETGKRFREDSLLLLRGLDSAAASLSQLTQSLNAAQQGLNDLAKPSLTSLQYRESHGPEDNDTEPDAKRHCGSTEFGNKDEEINSKNEVKHDGPEEVKTISTDVSKSGNLKKAKNMAISMASKAASLAKELKAIKSELYFVQERCNLLEEENRRLRDGVEKGVRSDDDDLVRLQLEALLAEKSRLANENANLTRENECLQQLVEYHQLATQEDLLSPSSCEQVLHGVCLDFSSPDEKEVSTDNNSEELENERDENAAAS